jgi:hypothetical protein
MKYKIDSLKTIAEIVANRFDLDTRMMFKYSREKIYKEPRQIFHYLAVQHTVCTYKEIGEFSVTMGRFKPHHHASILNSVKRIQGILEYDKGLSNIVSEIEDSIYKAFIKNPFGVTMKDGVTADLVKDVFIKSHERYLRKIKELVKLLSEDRDVEEVEQYIDMQRSVVYQKRLLDVNRTVDSLSKKKLV